MNNNDAKKNMIILAVAALVLLGVNAVVFILSQNGTLDPIVHVPLWFAFVVLNITSIIWAIAMLGLRPLVIALSYVTGGGIAYYAVQGSSSIPVSEAITAGAIYGAFGALTVGNFATKLRLAFFNKPQIPFVLVVIGLLVLDGMLNSQIFHADFVTISRAFIAPFMLAGVGVGIAERMILSSKHETGRIHEEMPVLVDQSHKMKMSMISDSGTAFRKLNFKAPEKPVAEDRKRTVARPPVTPPPAPVSRPVSQPVAAAASPKSDDGYGDIPISFGSNEPASTATEKKKEADKPAAKRQVTPEELMGKKATPAVVEPKPEEEEVAKPKSSSHLDLLNNIK